MCWQSVRLQHVLWLASVLMLGIGVRCYRLGQNSLWTDEFLSMECSSGWARTDLSLSGTTAAVPDLISLHAARPWTEIWSSIGDDENHPPLYFLMLRAWRTWFGDSPVALRSLSVLAAAVAIVLLFLLGVAIHSPRAALWACLLMAVASPQIEQSQDARAYMPTAVACLAAALAAVRIEQSGPTRLRCAALFLAALAAPLLHYMAFATLAAMAIGAACLMKSPARKSLLRTLAIALAAYALLWGPQLLSQHHRMMDGTAWMIDDQTGHVRSTLENLCTLPARLFLDLGDARIPIAALSVTIFFLPLLMFRRIPAARFWWIWLMVPVLVVLLIDLATGRQSLSMIKYTLMAAPGVYLLFGLLAAEVRRLGWIPAAVAAFCCIICIPSDYASELPDWRELSKTILQNSKPGDPVVFVDVDPRAYASDSELSATYYLAGQNRPLYMVNRKPTGRVLDELLKAHHVCVVASSGESLTWAPIPGMILNHVEMLVGMALVGTEDRPAAPADSAMARSR